MKLTYWVCVALNDTRAYSIRARTRREAKAQREADGPKRYGRPQKVTVEYKDAFDLVCHALGEGGIES